MTAALTSVKLSDKTPHAAEYVGGSGDMSGYKYALLTDISKITSFMSFFSIWLTTGILMNSYREKLISSIHILDHFIYTTCLLLNNLLLSVLPKLIS